MSDQVLTPYHEFLGVLRLCKALNFHYIRVVKTDPKNPPGYGTTIVATNKKTDRYGTIQLESVLSEKEFGSIDVNLFESRMSVIENARGKQPHELEFTEANNGLIKQVTAKRGRSRSSVPCQNMKELVMQYIPDKITNIDDAGRITLDKEMVADISRILQSAMISATTEIEKEQANVSFRNDGDDLIITAYDGRTVDTIERCFEGLAVDRKLTWAWDLTSFSQLLKIAAQRNKDEHLVFGISEHGFMNFHIDGMKCFMRPRSVEE